MPCFVDPKETNAAIMTGEIQGSLLDPEVQSCPLAHHAQLRELALVHRMPETGFYVISTYEDLKTVLSDPVTSPATLWSSSWGNVQNCSVPIRRCTAVIAGSSTARRVNVTITYLK